MSMIAVENLTFAYPSSYDDIFENVSFCIDTDWKLGFVGRNGCGKTTFLNLLRGLYDYRGHITSNVRFDYFRIPSPPPSASRERFSRKSPPMRRTGSYAAS
jgi:ATPase components of ABC transporters with duplicated ATPase domains